MESEGESLALAVQAIVIAPGARPIIGQKQIQPALISELAVLVTRLGFGGLDGFVVSM